MSELPYFEVDGSNAADVAAKLDLLHKWCAELQETIADLQAKREHLVRCIGILQRSLDMADDRS